jgi:hypothetical protein
MHTAPADRLLAIDDDLELCALVGRFLTEASFAAALLTFRLEFGAFGIAIQI